MKDNEIFLKDKRKFQFYEKLREKFAIQKVSSSDPNNVTDYMFIVPDIFVLVSRLAIEKRLKMTTKAFMAAVVAYFLLPIDIIPDFIPIIGFLDDLLIAVYALDRILSEVDPKIIQDNWSGETDMLKMVKKIISATQKNVSLKIIKKIKNFINKNTN